MKIGNAHETAQHREELIYPMKEVMGVSKVIRRIFAGVSIGALALVPLWTLHAASPAPVDLGSTADFAILAGAAITSTGGGSISMDLGLSPSPGSFITGLTAAQVRGTIYAVDGSGPLGSVSNPILLATAKDDLTAAYNDARDRLPVPAGAFLNPGDGNLGGMNLTPGLYKFTTTALITGADLTLTGDSNDVWIFQVGTALTVGSGIKVTLAGGAAARNIFWQVGSSATIGTSAIFKGSIMADQSITMNSGSMVEGRALARIAQVTFDGDYISLPAPDLVKLFWQLPASGKVCGWLINTEGSMISGFDIYNGATEWKVRGVGDIDMDGITDLIWQLPLTGEVYCWLLNEDGTMRSGVYIYGEETDWEIRGVGDIDMDGIADLVWQLPVTGQVYCWLMNSDCTMKSGHNIYTDETDWEIREACDMDADGIADLVWQLPATGKVYCWLMNSDCTMKSGLNIANAPMPRVVRGACDIDSDSIADLFWQLPATGHVSCWLMNSDGTMREEFIILDKATSWELCGAGR